MASVFSKKSLAALVACLLCALVAVVALSGCSSNSSSSEESSEDKTITVAASPTPHAEILNNAVKPILEEQGYTLEVKEFTDYVQPNTVTEAGEVDANYFQHRPYLENFNAEQGTHLVEVAGVHFEPMGIFSSNVQSLDEIEDGATVAVPNDATNEARALLLLEQEGLIEVDDEAGINATINDITSNPKNLQFSELEAANLPNVLQDVAIAVINGNYALAADFTMDDALAVEANDSLAAETYTNVVVVKDGNQNSEKIKALAAACNSDEVRDYINDNYQGSVVPVF